MFLWLLCHGRILSNRERVCRHLTTDCRCSVSGAVLEDLDHIFKQCPVAHSTWIPLIHDDKVDEFFALDFKQWIFVNLSNIGGFARDQVHWDVLFGLLMWNLWRKRNEWIFDTHVRSGKSILHHSMRMKREAVAARPSMPSGCISGGSDVGAQIRWVKPPRDNLEAMKLLNNRNGLGVVPSIAHYIVDILDRPWTTELLHIGREESMFSDIVTFIFNCTALPATGLVFPCQCCWNLTLNFEFNITG
ncbi:hypothetical protein V6N12_008026 [Hibiscus sabdariffa]|uniref:Reverse transcriptase zinc-binding domain-containing protein n=1 Tax=Hibiscus sabdariffa TaxID=183260 RepID=A0ABR2BSP3_9ROSI